MTILDCGCGLIETDIRLLEKYPNLNIHVVTNTNKKNKIIINNNIKNLKYEKKKKTHFIDYKDLLIRFDEIKFDRILFIESLSYSKNIQKIRVKKSIKRKITYSTSGLIENYPLSSIAIYYIA